MAELKAGDEVLVYRPSHKDGSPAKVVKIGRTLIHLQQGLRVETYDRDTQRLNGRQVGTGTYFRTAEQVKSSERNANALQSLRECGLSIDSGHKFTTDQVEALVKLVRTFGGQR
jgi:pyridoxine 5'-phosphate synthase PdxJ